MDIQTVKHMIAEFEELAIKAAAAISLLLVIAEMLTNKLSHLVSQISKKPEPPAKEDGNGE